MNRNIHTYRNQIAAVAIAMLAFTPLFAAPPATKYLRGETLDPSCAP